MWLSHKPHELKAAEITKVVIAAAMARMVIAVNIFSVGGYRRWLNNNFVTEVSGSKVLVAE